jgi:very-short-patch-repair endonuclease
MGVEGVVTGQRVHEVKLLRARELRREMTPEEQALWRCLRRSQFAGHHFRRQQVIEGFIVDFYCHAAGLIVEVDGPAHDDQTDYDEERDQILSARGLRILRFSNDAVQRDIAGVLSEIARHLHSTRQAY